MLVEARRVLPGPDFHAGKHGFTFEGVVHALGRCYHVSPDARIARTKSARVSHWYALANLPHKRRLQIEFDLTTNTAGRLILVVTAYTR